MAAMVTQASSPYLDLVRTPLRILPTLLMRGERPDPSALVGWEYRGVNMPATSRLLGLRRFIKGFTEDDRRVSGYNKLVEGHDLETPWTVRPQPDGREAYAPFSVAPVDPEAIDNRYLNALLLDYSDVEEQEPGIAHRLRDYVVRVVPGSDERLLGRAFLAVGRRRVPVGWFALERLGPVE
jgi:hypothetical protein